MKRFGVNGWANCYSEIKGNLYCSIMLLDKETDMWIQKQDCGVESNTEKEKGEASDAFKRACFNVGIGRELYTKIFIFVKVPTKVRTKKVNGQDEIVLVNGKKVYDLENPYEKWHVSDIKTNIEKEKIEYLQISDSNKNVVFTYDVNSSSNTKSTTDKLITEAQLKRLIKIANGNNEIAKRVINRYGYESSEKIKMSDYNKICESIENEIMM